MNLAHFHQRSTQLLAHVPDSLLLFASRVFPAAVFWQSGRTKVTAWQLNDSAVYLFQEEYRLPLIDPVLAAHAAAISEHLLPIFLVLGLATRVSALALISMTAVIQIFVYPDAWSTHGTWFALMGWVLVRGPGTLSLDHLFWPRGKVPTPRLHS